MSKPEGNSILSISVWRQQTPPDPESPVDPTDKTRAPVNIAMVNRIDLLGTMVKTFYSGSVKDTIIFTKRLAISRIARGHKAQLELPNDLPFDLFVYVRTDGLACGIVANEEYPPHVLWGLSIDVMRLFDAEHLQKKIIAVNEDKFLELPQMKEKIDKYQNPEEDAIVKVSDQVDSVKAVMRQNIQQILSNTESLESISEKSQDLDESAKLFFQNSKKANSCRRRWGCEIM